jgi:hypothetical protein
MENGFGLKACVSVAPFHLFRYCDGQAFRFNERKDNDAGRFVERDSSSVWKEAAVCRIDGESGERLKLAFTATQSLRFAICTQF